jgi:uncharacterized protein
MGRPIKPRTVCGEAVRTFVPAESGPGPVIRLSVEEYETIRLIDHERLSQAECADMMDVARTTVQAMYESARAKIADALINRKTIIVKGGHYTLCNHGTDVKHCLKNKEKDNRPTKA